MIIASYDPVCKKDNNTLHEIFALGICLARSGQFFSYYDTDLKKKNAITHFHLRTIRVQARINGQIKEMSGEKLANQIAGQGIRLTINVKGIPVIITEKSAMGSVKLQYKRLLNLKQHTKA